MACKNNPADRNVFTSAYAPEYEDLINTFAREADVSMNDAKKLLANPEDRGVAAHKAKAFAAAVEGSGQYENTSALAKEVQRMQKTPGMKVA